MTGPLPAGDGGRLVTERVFPQSLRREPALLTLDFSPGTLISAQPRRFLTPGLQSCERLQFCGFEPPLSAASLMRRPGVQELVPGVSRLNSESWRPSGPNHSGGGPGRRAFVLMLLAPCWCLGGGSLGRPSFPGVHTQMWGQRGN